MRTASKIFVCLVFIAVAFGGAYAQYSKPEDAIKYRKSVMFLIAQHFGRLGAMVKEKTPYDKEVFSSNAMVVEMLSHLPWEAFLLPGTDKGDTTLKSSAFEQQDKFKQSAEALETLLAKLVQVAQSGDFNAAKAQFGEVGKNCKACHDEFRNK